ncbi:MAG: GDSL-type esterase/lipase family protein [Candidatus Delongbacteria bacterium]
MKTTIIVINLILFVLIIILFIKGNFPEKIKNYCEAKLDIKDKYTYKMNYLYDVRKEQHMSYDIQADIVMLGDSMTEFADWSELTGRDDVVNRGISGDITEGMLKRLDTVFKVKPKICFFMGGINDIIRRVSYERIRENIFSVMKELQNNEIKPVIFSIIFTGTQFDESARINSLANQLNSDLEQYAKKNSIEYIDLNLIMCPEGFLKSEYTYDGLHLNADGYKIWSSSLKEYLEKRF